MFKALLFEGCAFFMKEVIKLVEKWKIALSEFLKSYEDDDDVVGALLCGSYASGNNNKESDIDVQLILKDDASYSERGNKIVNGYMIEYFMNPSWKIKEYFESNYEKDLQTAANMFGYGKIIYDNYGKVKELQEKALEYLDKDVKTIDDAKLLMNNYHMSHSLRNLKSLLDDKSPAFFEVYYVLLNSILNSYYEYVGLPKLPANKAYKILSDETYRKNYHIFKVPEDNFIKLYLDCYKENDADVMYKKISKLIEYCFIKCGNFKIDGFKLREDLY